MREVKYRAWDKAGKEYYYDIQTVYDCGWVPCCCPSFGHFLSAEITDEYGDGTGEKRFDVEQFTGLYDATKWEELTEDERADWTRIGNMPSEWKGREIYEGDNVESPGILLESVVLIDTERQSTILGGAHFFELDSMYPGFISTLKIIGNIHEDAK
jgi:hypothetical protein